MMAARNSVISKACILSYFCERNIRKGSFSFEAANVDTAIKGSKAAVNISLDSRAFIPS